MEKSTHLKLRLCPRLELLEARAQIQSRLLGRIVEFMSLGPIVTHSICEYLSMGIEAAFRDWLVHRFRRLELRPCVLVPETEAAVRSNGGQCSMNRMESDIVHGVHVLVSRIPIHSMTLERKVVLRINRIDVLDGHSSLDAAQSVSGRNLLLVPEHGHCSVLVFERTFLALELGGFVLQGVDDDAATGRSDNGHRIFDVRAVCTFRETYAHDGLLGASVPKLRGSTIRNLQCI